jgi:hypothetical protein
LNAARELLGWEVLEARASAPVLNLSRETKTLHLAEGFEDPSSRTSEVDSPDETWFTGAVWAETLQGLRDLGVVPHDSNAQYLLEAAPQLLRVNSSIVLKAAQFVCAEFSGGVLQAEPMLLSYSAHHLQAGIAFLKTMMGGVSTEVVTNACVSSPKLLVAGVEGALQERAVVDALGAASAATARATERAVGDLSAAVLLKKGSAWQKKRI